MIKHSKTAVGADSADPTDVQASDWNADHIGYEHGFVDRSSTLAFDNATRTLTISTAGSYDIYVGGVKTTISTNKTVVTGTGLGTHFVWFTDAGALATSQTPWDLLDLTVIPVATVHWDGATGIIGDERHDYRRNLIEHRNQHASWGAQYVSGFTPTPTFGPGATNTFTFAGGVFRDEDIYHTLTGNQTACRIGYRVTGAASMTFNASGTAYAKLNAGALQYDNAGTLTDVTSNSYGLLWIYASNFDGGSVISIVGQGEYATLVAAQAAPQPTLPGLSVAEWKLLYRVICRKTAVTPFAFTQVDVLYNQSTGPAISAGAVSTVNAGNVTVDASGFNGNLETTDTNLQLVAQKVDDLVLGGGFDYVPVTSITTTATAAFNTYHIASGTTADYTITLPTIAAGDIGKTLIIEIAASCTKLITLSGVDIDGQATRVMWAKEVAHLRADAVGKWVKIGGKSIPMAARISITNTNTVSIANSATVKVLWDYNVKDCVGMVDVANSRLRIKRGGLYNLASSALFQSLTQTSLFAIDIYVNTVSTATFSFYNVGSASGYPCAITTAPPILLVDGDYLEAKIYHSSGGARNLYTESTGSSTYLAASEVVSW